MFKPGHNIGIRKSRGVVLPTVLWITILSIVVAVNYASAVHLNTRTADNIKTSMMLRFDSTSGIYMALGRLLSEPATANANYQVPVNSSIVDIEVRSESLKTDINTADITELRDRFVEAGVDSETARMLAARVIDWRDSDHAALPYGMEDADYYAENREYGAKDKRIEDLVELALMADIDKNLSHRISDYFTVYGKGAGRIFTLTAWTRDASAERSYLTRAIVQITYQRNKPYRVLKWQHNNG